MKLPDLIMRPSEGDDLWEKMFNYVVNATGSVD